MDKDLVGQLCALAAALTWATALVLFKRSGERVPPLALNLFKNVLGLILLIATLAVMGDGVGSLAQFPMGDLAILALSGFLGIAVADTLFFYALNLIGVGLISIVECLYSPMVILCAFVILSETLTGAHGLGIALILFAVYVSSRHKPPENRTRGQLIAGMLLGGTSVALMAFGIVIAKPVLDTGGFPLIWAATLRLIVGTVALAMILWASPQRKIHFGVFKPAAVWRYTVPASVLGTYFAMIFWIAGFKYTQASIAGVLNQTSVVFALILATFVLKEPFTRRKLASVVLASAGVALITVYG